MLKQIFFYYLTTIIDAYRKCIDIIIFKSTLILCLPKDDLV